MALVGAMKVLIPLADVIDKDAEIARLSREIEKITKELVRGQAKLDNPDFLGRAPVHVVDKERTRVAELKTAAAELNEQRQRMQHLK
jgi:valyl-tRNA synthetase